MNPYTISPLESRYFKHAIKVHQFFSEFELMRNKIKIEVEYFIFLSGVLPEIGVISEEEIIRLRSIYNDFTERNYNRVVDIEFDQTRHDIKAVEYYVKEELLGIGFSDEIVEFVHYGLTSQDVVSASYAMAVKKYKKFIIHELNSLCVNINKFAESNQNSLFIARTHGQPAIPTSIHREYSNFTGRISQESLNLTSIVVECKIGGAIGNLAAHKTSYPGYDWENALNMFIYQHLDLSPSTHNTQIDNYRSFCRLSDSIRSISNILIDMCRDTWQYISMDYFKLMVDKNYIGSSTMPQKVNPIKFENAEGNLEIAVMWLTMFSNKFNISRLQRDLSDSTVIRNIGVPFAHLVIAIDNITTGISQLTPNKEVFEEELKDAYHLLAEPLQLILKKNGYISAYEAVKTSFQGVKNMTSETFKDIISNIKDSSSIKAEVFDELMKLTPANYYYL